MQRAESALIDDRSDEDFRAVYGGLATEAVRIDAAVGRIRLSGLDLSNEELASVERLRVLVAEINAGSLRSEAEAIMAHPHRGESLRLLTTLLGDGRLLVRSAPLASWSPDFSLFRRADASRTLLVGTHWFQRPYPHLGPALASLHLGPPAERMSRRFQEMWDTAHDIGQAVKSALEAAESQAMGDGASGS